MTNDHEKGNSITLFSVFEIIFWKQISQTQFLDLQQIRLKWSEKRKPWSPDFFWRCLDTPCSRSLGQGHIRVSVTQRKRGNVCSHDPVLLNCHLKWCSWLEFMPKSNISVKKSFSPEEKPEILSGSFCWVFNQGMPCKRKQI